MFLTQSFEEAVGEELAFVIVGAVVIVAAFLIWKFIVKKK